MDYHGVRPVLTLPIGDVLTCSFVFDVVGGTGRFDGADGEGIGTLSMVWLGHVPRAPACGVGPARSNTDLTVHFHAVATRGGQ